MVVPPTEHHPELLLKVVLPKLPAGSCCGESRSPLAKPAMEELDPRGETPRHTPALGGSEGIPAPGWITLALCLLENKVCRGFYCHPARAVS